MAIPEKIRNLANKVRNSVYGKDVRDSIAESMEETGEKAQYAKDLSDETQGRFEEQIQNMTLEDPSSAEIVDARGEHTVLRDRFKSIDQDLAQTATQKVDKNGSGQVTYANLSQEVREQFTGGNTAVVGVDSVIEENLTDNAVTPKKTSFLVLDKSKNMFDGRYERYYMSGSSGSLNLSSNSSGKCAIIEIEPNKTYSISLKFPVLWKYATSTSYITSGTFDGAVNVNGGDGDPTRVFTTGANDKYLYISVTNPSTDDYTDEEIYLKVVESDFEIEPALDEVYPYAPNKNIEVYSKGEINRIISENRATGRVRVVKNGSNRFFICYPAKSGNYLVYNFGYYGSEAKNRRTFQILDVTIKDSNLNTLYTIMPSGYDIDGVLKIVGEGDYVGGVHGNEQSTDNDWHVFVDGIPKNTTDDIDSYVNQIKFVVKSDVYHYDGLSIAFTKYKIVLFDENGVHIKNKWVPLENLNLEHVRGCLLSINKSDSESPLISKYMDSTVNIIPQDIPGETNSGALLVDENMTDATLTGQLVNAFIKIGDYGGNTYEGSIVDFGTRLKPYLDTYIGESVTTGQELYVNSHFNITTT